MTRYDTKSGYRNQVRVSPPLKPMSAQAKFKWRGALVAAFVGIASGALFVGYVQRKPQRMSGASDDGAATNAPLPVPARHRIASSVPKLTPPSFLDEQGKVYADAPGYNPSDVWGVVPMAKVFELEPRVEKWAGPVERYLSSKMEAELPQMLPDIKVKGVECHTATCRVSLDSSANPQLSVMRIQQTLAVAYSAGSGGYAGNGDFVLAFRGRTQWLKDVPSDDPHALFRAIEGRRTKLIASLKDNKAKGKPIPYKFLDVGSLPDD